MIFSDSFSVEMIIGTQPLFVCTDDNQKIHDLGIHDDIEITINLVIMSWLFL
jgi:hypothetical protein